MKRLLMTSAALGLSTSLAVAQTDFEGLVNVNIQDLLQDIAVDLNISDTNIPVVIQLPISVAANVCDVNVNVLAAQLSTGDAYCTAVTGSQELTQVVQQEMTTGGTTHGDTATTVGAPSEANADEPAGGAEGDAGTGATGSATTGDAGTGTAAQGEAQDEDAPRFVPPGQAAGHARDAAPGRTKENVPPGHLRRLQNRE